MTSLYGCKKTCKPYGGLARHHALRKDQELVKRSGKYPHTVLLQSPECGFDHQINAVNRQTQSGGIVTGMAEKPGINKTRTEGNNRNSFLFQLDMQGL